MSDFIQVMVTFDKKADARRVSAALVGERLAACVQVVGPIESTYEWQGKVETEEEFMLQIKTRAALYAAVERRVLELHPYDCAEVIAVPIVDGSRGYLDWVAEQTAGSHAPKPS